MNKITREELNQIKDKLFDIAEDLENLSNEEQEKADNLPDNLQSSEVADKFQSSADALQEVADNLNDAISTLEDIQEGNI